MYSYYRDTIPVKEDIEVWKIVSHDSSFNRYVSLSFGFVYFPGIIYYSKIRIENCGPNNPSYQIYEGFHSYTNKIEALNQYNTMRNSYPYSVIVKAIIPAKSEAIVSSTDFTYRKDKRLYMPARIVSNFILIP